MGRWNASAESPPRFPRVVPWILVAVGALWNLVFMRGDSVLVAMGALVILAVTRPSPLRTYVAMATGLTLLVWPMQPIEVTMTNGPGPPHLVSHCSIRGPEGVQGARRDQTEGRCFIASDISGPFAPSKYLVW